MSFTSSLNTVPTPNGLLNTMEVMKLAKLSTFSVISIIDSKLIIKLPKCMLVFSSLISRAKSPFKVLIPPYFGQNPKKSPHDQTYIFFNISLHIISQNALIISLTYTFNPNKPFWLHIRISIIQLFRKNSRNTQF